MKAEMKRFLHGLVLRPTVATILAACGSLAIITPTPRWTWPAILLLYYPVGLLWRHLLGWSEWYPLLGPHALWNGLAYYTAAAIPIYTALLYVPSIARKGARVILRLTRTAIRDRGAFVVYFACFAVVGGFLGFSGWASSNLTGGSLGLIGWVIFGSMTVGWIA